MAVGVLLLSTHANGAVVCAKASKKGQIKKITLRPACIGKETSLTSKDLPPSGALVRDANGQEVGAVDNSGDVLWRHNGQLFAFRLRKDGPQKARSDFEVYLNPYFGNYYLTPDCSGQPYQGSLGHSIEEANEEGANTVIPRVLVSETGTKGYYYTDGAISVDASVEPIYYGIVRYTDTGTPTCDVGDAPVGDPFPCDPKLFCQGIPLPASCSCIKCCHLGNSSGTRILIPQRSVDLPVFAAPFSIER